MNPCQFLDGCLFWDGRQSGRLAPSPSWGRHLPQTPGFPGQPPSKIPAFPDHRLSPSE